VYKFKPVLLGLSILALAPFANIQLASAQNAYAKQQLNQTNTGGYFYSLNGQEDLAPPSPDTTYKLFITKEMWLLDGRGNWVETGTVKGYTSPDGVSSSTEYWAGHYYAKQRTNGTTSPLYQRILIGPYKPTGAHSYQLERDTSTGFAWNWTILIDGGDYIGTVAANNSSFPYMQVGLETNNGYSKFKNGTVANSMYYRNTSDSWTKWPSSGLLDGDNGKIPDWNSVYNGVNNSITFSTNAPWP